MNTKGLIVFSGVVCILVSSFVSYKKAIKLEDLRRDRVLIKSKMSPIAMDHLEAVSLRAQIQAYKKEIERLENVDRGSMVDLKGDHEKGEFETVVGDWLRRIDQLSEYLSFRKDLWIPELKFLTAKDWLDVTIDGELSSEADFRLALANLRLLAKHKVSRHISSAFWLYLKNNNGELPEYTSLISDYLHESVDPSILKRYEARKSDGSNPFQLSVDPMLIEIGQPDKVWYSTTRIGPNGSLGFSQSITSIEPLENAILAFELEHKRPPANGSELQPFFEKRYEQEILDEMLRAMNTMVEARN